MNRSQPHVMWYMNMLLFYINISFCVTSDECEMCLRNIWLSSEKKQKKLNLKKVVLLVIKRRETRLNEQTIAISLMSYPQII